MIRTFFEFLLSRSHDEGTLPTSWFRRLLLRNVGLNRFDAETRQLDTLLRNSAAEQRQAMAANNTAAFTLPPYRKTATTAHKKNTSHTLAWLSGLAACALLLVSLPPSWLRPAAPTVHAGKLSQQLTIVPGKILGLLTLAAKTSQTEVPQFSPLANLTLPSLLPDWEGLALRVESPVRQEIDIWQEVWQDFTSRRPFDSQNL